MKAWTDERGNLCREIEDWGQFLNRAIHHPCAYTGRERSSRTTRDARWAGTETWEEAVSIAIKGWTDGVGVMRKLSTRISSVVTSKIIRPEASFAECGDEVDVGRYLTGEPECFVHYPLQEMRASGGKVFSVGFGGFMSAGVDKDRFVNRGAAVLAIVDSLESAGYRCELDLCMAVTGYRMRCPIKMAEQPAELDRLAFTMMHPASFRRIMFSFWETDPEGSAVGTHGQYYWRPDTCQKPPKDYDFWFPDLGLGTEEPYVTVDSALDHTLGLLCRAGLVEIEQCE